MSDYENMSLDELREQILDDGVIDADEVTILYKRLYADGKIDGEEADFLFRLNDATSDQPNDPSWQRLFVKALTDHVVNKPGAPGIVDHKDAEVLIRRIERDGRLTTNEIALLNSLAHATAAPSHAIPDLGEDLNLRGARRWQQFSDSAALIRTLHLTIAVFQTATDAPKLFESAIRGAVEIVGLDSARVLLYRDGQWCESCSDSDPIPTQLKEVESMVLGQVAGDKRTFWENSFSLYSTAELPPIVWSCVAAPILDESGQVIGALCGSREQADATHESDITIMDAMLMELLSCGVASGLTHMSREDSAKRLRLQFEQFFTPDLARRIEQDPQILDGREAEVSILFCDVDGFTSLCERKGTALTFQWMHDVLSDLSACVQDYHGVLVDYVGDELMAMWGAPETLDNHAELACLAALKMLDALDELNARWSARLGTEIDLKIGINSGTVMAGNTGSRLKFKYGPRGNAVNVASRLTGASKYLRSRILISSTTASQLSDSFPTRRIGGVQVVNIDETVELFELVRQKGDDWPRLSEDYAAALAAFESKDFRYAARLVGQLVSDHPDDGPSMVLLSRSVDALVNGPGTEHPVWVLPGK